ncbi:MAG: ABC-F family ATP-binding cassette domain-containing protein [Acidobacteriota bacterium]
MLYRLDGVAVAFAGRTVLRDVTLQHNPGEKLILLGRNGSGKTTLLRVIAGLQDADGGTVSRAKGLTVARLEQLLEGADDQTVLDFCLEAFAEVVAIEREMAAHEQGTGEGPDAAARFHQLHESYERLDGYRVRPRVETAIDAIGLGRAYHPRRLGTLSGGERTRAALVRALLAPSDLLLLDEPTNHLDLIGVEFLAGELARREGGLLLVSHDREVVDRVGGEILELHGGRLERYPSGYARYRRERQVRRDQQRREYELQRQEILRQEEFIRRNIAGQNTRQAQARQKLLDRVERLEPPEPDAQATRLRWPEAGRSGDRVLEAEDIAVGYERPMLRGVSFVLRRRERLAIVGRNGAGKSTLLRCLAGEQPPLDGRIVLGRGVVPGIFDQDHADLPPGADALGILLEARPDWAPADARAWAGRFGFSGERAEAATRTMSGGERARLSLARLIAGGPNLMLLDEPTNHLDTPTCEALEEALEQFPGALVLVSHDRRLVERVATRVLLLDGGATDQLGTVAEAFSRIGLAAQPARPREEERGTATRRSAAEEERRRLRRDAAKARLAADALLAELEAAEARGREIEELLCRREVFSDPARARSLAAEAEDLRESVGVLTDDWAAAEEDAEALERALAALAEQ